MTQAHSPTPAELHSLRAAYGLTQSEIGALLYANNRTWRQWETGLRQMHPVYFELLKIKLTELLNEEKQAAPSPSGGLYS